MKIAGWVLTVLTTLFLLVDGGMKLAGAQVAVDATTQLGFGADQVRVLGIVLIVCTLLYLAPPTALLGAVLVTAYLGGAVAINYQHRTPVVSHLLFGVYVGVMLWGGLALRSDALRSLLSGGRSGRGRDARVSAKP